MGDAGATRHDNPTTLAQRTEREKAIKRNPHPDFKLVEGSRPDWTDEEFRYTKTVDPNWQWGQGGNDGGASLDKDHVEINPYAEGET